MGLSWTWPIVLSHRNSFFGDFIFLSIIRRPPSIFEINRTKCLILVIIGLHILHNHLSLALLGSAWPSLAQLGPAWPSLAQQLYRWPEIVVILMKLIGYALSWIISCYRWLLSKTFWTILLILLKKNLLKNIFHPSIWISFF